MEPFQSFNIKTMSRTNPYKKKPKAARLTLLMYGEGLNEEMFLKYLRGLYARQSGFYIKIKNGRGGDAVSIIINASNEPGGFDSRIVVLDNDKGNEEMQKARQEAKKRNIKLLENTPCLEAVLLAILNNGGDYSNKQSNWCKSKFESEYLGKKDRTELNKYENIFPKLLLDKQKNKVPELKKFISIMEGGKF